jgi:hypothetical protein
MEALRQRSSSYRVRARIATVANKTELGAYPLTAATNTVGIAKGSDEGMIIKTGDAGDALWYHVQWRVDDGGEHQLRPILKESQCGYG